jgi:pimeloyl-ACP methyl ester carboxylesterase/DNA-binding CsgD family transcriptional regulator
VGGKPQRIRFCRSPDGVRIAFATAGEGPPLVRINNWFTHLELDWENPVWRHWSEALVERRTLVRYDPRGSGLSDRDVADLSLDALVCDLEAVVDALGLRRVSLIGLCQGGVIATAYAARRPERVGRLVLYDSYLHGAFAGDTPEYLAKQAKAFAQVIELGWGRKVGAFREMFANLLMPEAAGPQVKWIGELQRRSASPATACSLWNVFNTFDIRAEAPKVTAPTLVFHVRGDAMVPFEAGRRLAAAIPNARFVPLEGRNHILRADEPAWAVFRKELNDFLAADEPADESAADAFSALTAREREILDCIARGLPNPEIAASLHIAEKTVRNHVTSIFSKLGTEHRSQAIVIARKAGLGRD